MTTTVCPANYTAKEVEEMCRWLLLADDKTAHLTQKHTVGVRFADNSVCAVSLEVTRIGDKRKGLIVGLRVEGELAAQTVIERFCSVLSAISNERRAQNNLVEHCIAILTHTRGNK